MGYKKKKMVSVLAAAGLMGLAFVVTEPTIALAGMNGQQISFCANGTDYQHVAIDGYNQKGEFVEAGDMIYLHPGECHDLKNYYWGGWVKVTWQNSLSGNFPEQVTTCLIPRQYSSDMYTCMPRAVR